MTAKLKEAFGVDATIIEGSNGIFDVIVNGDLVYSKHQTGQFPDEDKLVSELQAS